MTKINRTLLVAVLVLAAVAAVAAVPTDNGRVTVLSAPGAVISVPAAGAADVCERGDVDEATPAAVPATELSLGKRIGDTIKGGVQTALGWFSNTSAKIAQALRTPTNCGVAVAVIPAIYGDPKHNLKDAAMVAAGTVGAVMSIPLYLASYPFIGLAWLAQKLQHPSELIPTREDFHRLVHAVTDELKHVYAKAQSIARTIRDKIESVAHDLKHEFVIALRKAAQFLHLRRLEEYTYKVEFNDLIKDLEKIIEVAKEQELKTAAAEGEL